MLLFKSTKFKDSNLGSQLPDQFEMNMFYFGSQSSKFGATVTMSFLYLITFCTLFTKTFLFELLINPQNNVQHCAQRLLAALQRALLTHAMVCFQGLDQKRGLPLLHGVLVLSEFPQCQGELFQCSENQKKVHRYQKKSFLFVQDRTDKYLFKRSLEM